MSVRIRINDVENEALFELIKKRTLQQDTSDFLEWAIASNQEIDGLFIFMGTPEGQEFWDGVLFGKITELKNKES